MNVMPFGLCNSLSTFQRILDTALASARNTESYVDDCITHSRGFEEHLKIYVRHSGASMTLESSWKEINSVLDLNRALF